MDLLWIPEAPIGREPFFATLLGLPRYGTPPRRGSGKEDPGEALPGRRNQKL